MRQWTTHGIVGKFADLARTMRLKDDGTFDTSAVNFNRMRQLGLDDAMLQRVLAQAKANMDTVPGAFFSTKVNRINLDKWQDQEAAINFVRAVQRFSSKVVQDNDIGAMHRWFSHPLWRLMLQLRNFPVAAWDKRLLHNFHMRDGNALAYFIADTAIPAMIYGAQHSVASIGRADSDEYLRKHLSLEQLAKAGFQRSSYASILPMAYDTLALTTGAFPPIFDARSSEQPSDVLTGNTIKSSFDDASNALHAVTRPIVNHRALTQDEIHAVQRMFTNNMVIGAVVNMMTRGLRPHVPFNETRH